MQAWLRMSSYEDPHRDVGRVLAVDASGSGAVGRSVGDNSTTTIPEQSAYFIQYILIKSYCAQWPITYIATLRKNYHFFFF
jgi:hypothetical protein